MEAMLGPLVQIAAILLVPLAAYIATGLLNALSAHTAIKLTELQRAQVIGSIRTAAGEIAVGLARGTISLTSPSAGGATLAAAVADKAAAALAAVPTAATALGVTQAGMSRMVLGQVGHLIAADPTIPTLPLLAARSDNVATFQTDASGRPVQAGWTPTDGLYGGGGGGGTPWPSPGIADDPARKP